MTLVKQHPRSINYLFDEFFNGFPTTWGKDVVNNYHIPAVNVHETNDGYHVELVAPGRNKEDFNINLEGNVLTIGYEKKEQTENADYKTIRREFSFKSFKRSFTLDEKVNVEGIQAKYDNGVLKLFIPKKEDIKLAPKTIEIL